jgi:pyridoxine/pyridoxamine 5'-phosphate oxidase
LNPQGSICFFWESILRQVRITGPIHKISEEEMILDFSRESLESRLSIYLNNQELENLKNKEVLINLKQKFIFFFKYF